MTRRQVLVQLSEELVEALDREAGRTGASRSAVLREAAAQYLAETEDARITRAILEGYARAPQTENETDEWGPLGAWADAALEETMRSLAGEERAAGLEPPS